MGKEIERKFLVVGDEWRKMGKVARYKQGYLCADPARTVRVRLEGDAGKITVKGPNTGASRSEYEYPIPRADADEILETLCEKPLIEKQRRKIEQGDLVWEVDEFEGENAGLIVAEIELESEDQPFERPAWIGEEVTGDRRYYNSSLMRKPFNKW